MPPSEARIPLLYRLRDAFAVARAATPSQRVSAISRFPFSGMGGGYTGGTTSRGGWWGGSNRLPGSNVDYAREVGAPWLNSAVAICLNWVADNITEPEFQVVRKAAEVDKPVEGHPLTQLLANPNPWYNGDALLQATATDYLLSGNAYWVKARNGYGTPLQLYWVPSWQMFPRWEADGSTFISDYLYRVDRHQVSLPVESVVHFRFGLDMGNYRFGTGRARPVLREIYSDNECATYTAALVHNMGVAGVWIGPEDEHQDIQEDEASRLQEAWSAKYTGDGRGRPFVSSNRLKIQQVGFSPEQLRLESLPNRAEDRIAAMFRLSPMVVGLTSGAAHKTFANYAEARKAAYEDCLIPITKTFAVTVNHQLLPDLGDPNTEKARYDFSEVQALAEDENEKATRWTALYQGGVALRSEARAEVGLKVDRTRDDVFFADAQAATAIDTQKALGDGQDRPNGKKTGAGA